MNGQAIARALCGVLTITLLAAALIVAIHAWQHR